MNQYERANAIGTIEAYFIPRPNETEQAAFERAKVECLKHLRDRLAHVESITSDRFLKEIK